jgi:hypothetical protein
MGNFFATTETEMERTSMDTIVRNGEGLRGIRLGLAGYLLSALTGYGYLCSRDELWELQGNQRKDGRNPR